MRDRERERERGRRRRRRRRRGRRRRRRKTRRRSRRTRWQVARLNLFLIPFQLSPQHSDHCVLFPILYWQSWGVGSAGNATWVVRNLRSCFTG